MVTKNPLTGTNRQGFFSAKFISFEGIDGCGKSTLLNQLSRWLEERGIAHIKTREPGGTIIGERIRQILLDPSLEMMDQRTEVLLYSASRAQHVQEVILPGLNEGKWVLADRYIDATLAYQGFGRGLDTDTLRSIQDWTAGGLWPHRTVLLDCDIGVAFNRMGMRKENLDRMEQENRSFHQRVREGYLELAGSDPRRFLVLDASKELPQVIEDFHTRFRQLFDRNI
jgi:dTMP kinase